MGLVTSRNKMIKKNLTDNAEFETDEYRNGKRIYKRRIIFSDNVVNNTTINLDFGFTSAWLDFSESYFKSGSFIVPLPIGMVYGKEDKVNPTINGTKLLFYADTDWGTNWIKCITIKYTKD